MKKILFAAAAILTLLVSQAGTAGAETYTKTIDCANFDKVSAEVISWSSRRGPGNGYFKCRTTINIVQSDRCGIELTASEEKYADICEVSVSKKGTLSIVVRFDGQWPSEDTEVNFTISMPTLTELSATGLVYVKMSGDFETSGNLKVSLSSNAEMSGLKAHAKNADISLKSVTQAKDIDITADGSISLKSASVSYLSSAVLKADAIDVTVSDAGHVSDSEMKANTLSVNASMASNATSLTASFTTGEVKARKSASIELKSFSEDDFSGDLKINAKDCGRVKCSDLYCKNVNVKLNKVSYASVYASESLTYKADQVSSLDYFGKPAKIDSNSPKNVNAH